MGNSYSYYHTLPKEIENKILSVSQKNTEVERYKLKECYGRLKDNDYVLIEHNAKWFYCVKKAGKKKYVNNYSEKYDKNHRWLNAQNSYLTSRKIFDQLFGYTMRFSGYSKYCDEYLSDSSSIAVCFVENVEENAVRMNISERILREARIYIRWDKLSKKFYLLIPQSIIPEKYHHLFLS